MESGNSVQLPKDKIMICTSNYEDNTFDDAATKGPEEKKMMTCAKNCEDNTFHVEVSPLGHDSTTVSKKSNGDTEVDIVHNVVLDEERVVEMEPWDATESSSSFGCTEDSGIGNTVLCSDVEVESQMQDNNTSILGGGLNDLFRTRKKKSTAHWRKFIRPLMWRCRWVELQIRELQAQACKYDREILDYEKNKRSLLEKCGTEKLGAKSVPFLSQNHSVKLMKREKRKRVEETFDIASYTSGHSLFSYYASSRPITGLAYLDDDHGNTDVAPVGKTPLGNDDFGADAEWVSFKDSNAFESILRTIDEAQLQVHQLRLRMDKVVREHTEKFTSDSSNFAPVDPLASCAPNSPLLCVNASSQHTSERRLAMAESAALICGDVTPHPDMVERTEQPLSEGKCEKMEHEFLIHNQPVKEDLNDTEVGNQRSAESQLATKGKTGNVQHAPDPNSASKMPTNREQPAVKIRSISKLITPKNKRKRGRRKARTGRWNRRSSG